MATSRITRHIFVCANERPEGGRPACGTRGSVELLRAIAQAAAARPDVAVTACACLGPCFDGPAAVVYPGGEWYGALAPADAQALVDGALPSARRLTFAVDD